MSDDIKWPSWDVPQWGIKVPLSACIRRWVAQKIGIDNIYIPTLDRTNYDELILIAMAMGYQPPPMIEKGIRVQHANRKTKELQRQAAADVKAGRPIFLPDETE